jgi:hypothetical protein
MRIWSVAILATSFLCIQCILGGVQVQAQSIYFAVADVALKNGETTEFADLYHVSSNCQSLLIGTPEVEIIDGPPGVTVAVKAAKIVPRYLGCAKPVSGGKLLISAKDIDEPSRTRMVIRINYKTRSGDRQRSQDINISLFP